MCKETLLQIQWTYMLMAHAFSLTMQSFGSKKFQKYLLNLLDVK